MGNVKQFARAYMMHPGPGEDKNRIVLVDEDGYRPVEEYDCSPVSHRPDIVQRLNEHIGLTSKLAVDKIIAHSMTHGCAL